MLDTQIHLLGHKKNNANISGLSSAKGNESSNLLDGNNYVSYRGEENLWGDIWKLTDLIYANSTGVYIKNNNSGTYNKIPFSNITAKFNGGYISAFGYDSNYDYLFMPSEANGNSALSIGDQVAYDTSILQGDNGTKIYLSGGSWVDASSGIGMFITYFSSIAISANFTSTRIIYI